MWACHVEYNYSMHCSILLKFVFFNDRLMDNEASTFEDIVDAYLAYLQVNFMNESTFHVISLILLSTYAIIFTSQFVRID